MHRKDEAKPPASPASPSRPGTSAPAKAIRCAIYTRKSSEEGLDQEYNSLDAQRESAEAYIASQRNEGWTCLPDRYDDGGFTGGNMERPALKRLMADIEAGKVDCVVVYKVDRLSRSLRDFLRITEEFERKGVSFVSITQQFNTTSSAGRLMVNVLLSFAQFERELVSERTRDKIASARRKGKWSGGRSVLGYDIDPVTRRLVVNPEEASLVREIFDAYLKKHSLLAVANALTARGLRTKAVPVKKEGGGGYGGRPWDKSAVIKVLTNVLYHGRVRHKAETYPGEHEAIIADDVWTRTQEMLRSNGRTGGMLVRNKHGALLKGLLHCSPCGTVMGHTSTCKAGTRLYRYYVCYTAQKRGWDVCPCKSIPADQIEGFVVEQIGRIGQDPALMSMVLAKCRDQTTVRRDQAQGELTVLERELARHHAELAHAASDAATNPHAVARLADLHEKIGTTAARATALKAEIADADAGQTAKGEVDAALGDFATVWTRLTPKEQSMLIRVLIKAVHYDATKGSIAITFHHAGLQSIGSPTLTGAAA